MKQRLLIFLVFCLVSFASALPEKALAGFDLFDTTSNQLIFPKGDSAFTPFFEKLDSLVFENKGKIRILHIGGSHIQADVISGKIRERFAFSDFFLTNFYYLLFQSVILRFSLI